jgi:hypothetical protein
VCVVCVWRQKVTRLSRHVLMPCLGLVRLVRNEPSPRGTPWADFKSGMQGKCRSVWPVSEAKPKRISFPNPIPQLTPFPVSYYTLRIEAEEERRRAQRWGASGAKVTRRRRGRSQGEGEDARRRCGRRQSDGVAHLPRATATTTATATSAFSLVSTGLSSFLSLSRPFLGDLFPVSWSTLDR